MTPSQQKAAAKDILMLLFRNNAEANAAAVEKIIARHDPTPNDPHLISASEESLKEFRSEITRLIRTRRGWHRYAHRNFQTYKAAAKAWADHRTQANRVVVQDEAGKNYVAFIRLIRAKGMELNRAHGVQIALPLRLWAGTGDEALRIADAPETPAARTNPVAEDRQQSLL